VNEAVAEPDASASALPVRRTLRAVLRLFLSADIVGSTAFKQRTESDSDGGKWFDTVGNFYRHVDAEFGRQWKLAHQLSPKKVAPALFGERAPELWKTIGDEVLFTLEIEDAAQAKMCLHVWIATLEKVRVFLSKADASLDVKSCAWLADFPIRNREVVLSNPEDTQENFAWANDRLLQRYADKEPALVRDFIGPSIDTGFRLGASASPRQLMVSVELAHLLSGEECNRRRDLYDTGPYQIPELIFRYGGRASLKDVLNSAPYPHVWIDIGSERDIHKAEDLLLVRPTPTCQQIHAFTTAFISEHPDKFCTRLRFALSESPAAYTAHCARMDQHIAEQEQRFRTIEEATDREGGGPSPETEPARELQVALPIEELLAPVANLIALRSGIGIVAAAERAADAAAGSQERAPDAE
jgi:hypothetical protein